MGSMRNEDSPFGLWRTGERGIKGEGMFPAGEASVSSSVD